MTTDWKWSWNYDRAEYYATFKDSDLSVRLESVIGQDGKPLASGLHFVTLFQDEHTVAAVKVTEPDTDKLKREAERLFTKVVEELQKWKITEAFNYYYASELKHPEHVLNVYVHNKLYHYNILRKNNSNSITTLCQSTEGSTYPIQAVYHCLVSYDDLCDRQLEDKFKTW